VGGTLIPNLGTLGLRVLELFAMYTMDGQTDKRMDGRTKATLIAPLHTVGGITSIEVMAQPVECSLLHARLRRTAYTLT